MTAMKMDLRIERMKAFTNETGSAGNTMALSSRGSSPVQGGRTTSVEFSRTISCFSDPHASLQAHFLGSIGIPGKFSLKTYVSPILELQIPGHVGSKDTYGLPE